jgi:hypothetical protein
VNVEQIPAELRSIPRWLLRKLEERKEKLTKVPYSPISHYETDATSGGGWPIDAVLTELPKYDGVGFCFSAEDSILGIDLDKCRDPETGIIEDWAQRWITWIYSYTEISPSGLGIHIWCRGELPEGRRRKGSVEMYEEKRYFTVTGAHVAGTPLTIEERSRELAVMHKEIFPDEPPSPPSGSPAANGGPHVLTDDAALIDKACSSSPGFERLWSGNIAGYDSHSEADAALCAHLAWWCNRDIERMDNLFRASGLYREEKWERESYRDPTLSNAAALVTGGYEGPAESVEITVGEKTSFVEFVLSSIVNGLEESPTHLEPEALYGLPGDIVKAIDPHTESHPAAVLMSLVTGVSCLIGRSPHVFRDGKRQTVNEFAVLVGLSSKGRKGTATSRVEEILKYISDRDYYQMPFMSHEGKGGFQIEVESLYEGLRMGGLGSGEALVEALSDKDADKRRIVVEEEFSRYLKVMGREGSTLSEIIRAAWDGTPLSNRTKGKHLRAVGTHIAVLGHITEAELRLELTGAALYNGFSNRFLWICCNRSKSLPMGGGRPDTIELTRRLQETIYFAQKAQQVEFDADCKDIWSGKGGVYDALINRPPGLLGAVTSRAEAHVTRLALFWALMDLDREIRLPHLMAALAVWDYNENGCAYLFGRSTGSEVADKIEEALLMVSPGGLTQTEIWNVFQRNAKAGAIPAALKLLESLGRAEMRKAETEKNRPAMIWFASAYDRRKNEFYERSPLHVARRLTGGR